MASPKHNLSSGRRQLNSKPKGKRAVKERGRGISRRAGQCIQPNTLQRNRKASRDGTNAPPQSSLQRVHRYSPRNCQTSIQNIPLLPRSALPAVLGVCLCLRTRCVRPGDRRQVRDIRRYCGRSVRRSTCWRTRCRRSRDLGTGTIRHRPKTVSDKVFLGVVGREFLLSEIDGSPVATSWVIPGGRLRYRASIRAPKDEQVDGRIRRWNGLLVGVDVVRPS